MESRISKNNKHKIYAFSDELSISEVAKLYKKHQEIVSMKILYGTCILTFLK